MAELQIGDDNINIRKTRNGVSSIDIYVNRPNKTSPIYFDKPDIVLDISKIENILKQYLSQNINKIKADYNADN